MLYNLRVAAILRDHQIGFHEKFTPLDAGNTDADILKNGLGGASSLIDSDPVERIWHRPDKGEKMHELFQIRWNLEEFKVDYPELMEKTAVGKYFLEELVDERGKPTLMGKIDSPKGFWLE
jgi:hypothetical protein